MLDITLQNVCFPLCRVCREMSAKKLFLGLFYLLIFFDIKYCN